MKELKTSFHTVGSYTYMTIADPNKGNALRNVSPRSDINQDFEEALRHDANLAHEQQVTIKQLLTSLKAVVVCLEQHIRDEAKLKGVNPQILCPCTGLEIKQAHDLIKEIE